MLIRKLDYSPSLLYESWFSMMQNQEIHFTCLSMQIGNIANTLVEIVVFLQMQLQAKSLNWLPGGIFVILIIPNCLTYLHFPCSSCRRL